MSREWKPETHYVMTEEGLTVSTMPPEELGIVFAEYNGPYGQFTLEGEFIPYVKPDPAKYAKTNPQMAAYLFLHGCDDEATDN